MFNPFGTYTRNGVPPLIPDGYDDSDFAYVASFPPDPTTGFPLAALASATFQFFTYSDSVFIWTGLDVPNYYQAALRFRYGTEYLDTEFLNVSPFNLLSMPSTVFPIFPAHMPPGSQVTIEATDLSGVNNSNFQISLTGIRRVKL